MKTKTFDCVEMKRRGAAQIHEETKDLSFDEKVAYWQNLNVEAREAQRRAMKRRATENPDRE
jgi:hypothetical protein